MSWHGIGLISGHWTPRVDPGIFQPPPASVSPSSQWIGQPGTGFTSIPVDPVRTTAKAACRLLTPPFQWFTEMLDVGVIAAANENGSLANNLGIAHVIFHFEGGEAVVERPTWRTMMTQRGPRTYLGWWARLLRPAMKNGHAHLFVEAVPRDSTMQARVIGPFVFSPQANQHDAEIIVAPSQPQVVDVSYRTLEAAVDRVKNQGIVNPLITIKEPGLYRITNSSVNAMDRNGYCNITSDVPLSGGQPQVWIGTDSETSADVTMSDNRQKLHIFGPNIGLDFRYMQGLSRHSSGAGLFDHWLDGIVITSTAPNGVNTLWRGGTRYATNIITGRPWFTECDISEVLGPCNNARLIRGCDVRNTTDDAANVAFCVVQSTFTNHQATIFWNENRPIMTVRYDGAESVATISRRGHVQGQDNGDGVGMFRVTIGTTNYDFVVGDGGAAYFNGTAGDGYTVQDVVDWLNGLPGITAVNIDTEADRGAHCASLGRDDSNDTPFGTKGSGWGFPRNSTPPLNIKSTTRTITAHYDLHADWYQHGAGVLDNIILFGNRVIECGGIILMLGPVGSGAVQRDVFVVANAFGRNTIQTGDFSPVGRDGGGYTASHLVIVHNSWSGQGVRLRGDNTQPPADPYNLIANNAMPGLSRGTNGSWPGLVMDGNHLSFDAVNPTGATNTSFGGDGRNYYVDAAAGDFRPAAPLVAALKTPAVPFDQNGVRFDGPAPVGALAQSPD